MSSEFYLLNNQQFRDVDSSTQISLDEVHIPTLCPICNVTSKPQILSKFYRNNINEILLFITAYCDSCKLAYIAIETYKEIYNGATAEIIYTGPSNFGKKDFGENINEISPLFHTIYNQALEADGLKLNHISGMGFRKAAEYLITDYLRYIQADNEQTIKIIEDPKSTLMTKINLLDDANLIASATACAWIGNDETHILRQHTEYGIDDLKSFIDALVYFINYKLVVTSAIKLIAK